MTKKIILVAVITLVSLYSLPVLAQVVVIVHPSNSAELNKSDITRIFLGKSTSFPNSNKAKAINQDVSSAVRQSFDSDILGRPTSQVQAYWNKLLFTGNGTPPDELANDADVINLVASDPSAIGYIDAASATDAVKLVSL